MYSLDQSTARTMLRRLRLGGICFVVVIAAILIYGLVSRAAENSRLHDQTEAQAVPNVAVAVSNSRRVSVTGVLLGR